MKILFYIENLRSGGKERRLVELIKGLSKYPDIKMTLVLTKDEIHYTDIFKTEIKIYYTIRKGLKKDPRLFFKFYNIVKKVKPDIIHVWGNMVAVYAIPTKILLGIPMINNQITDAPPKFHNTVLNHKITFPFSDLIIANSKAGLKVYNAPKRKSICIYNGFNFNRLKNLTAQATIKRQFNIKTKYVIAMVASFSDLKDYKTYILSALQVLTTRSDVSFLCVGSGNATPYKQMVPTKNKRQILFLGRQENVESIMNICDIGVLMSNPALHGEGISNALLEFMALGKPVIACNSGGTKELILNNKNGFIIKAQDVEALATKINILLGNNELRKDMGLKSKMIAINKFGINRMINEFEKVYNKFDVNNYDE